MKLELSTEAVRDFLSISGQGVPLLKNENINEAERLIIEKLAAMSFVVAAPMARDWLKMQKELEKK